MHTHSTPHGKGRKKSTSMIVHCLEVEGVSHSVSCAGTGQAWTKDRQLKVVVNMACLMFVQAGSSSQASRQASGLVTWHGGLVGQGWGCFPFPPLRLLPSRLTPSQAWQAGKAGFLSLCLHLSLSLSLRFPVSSWPGWEGLLSSLTTSCPFSSSEAWLPTSLPGEKKSTEGWGLQPLCLPLLAHTTYHALQNRGILHGRCLTEKDKKFCMPFCMALCQNLRRLGTHCENGTEPYLLPACLSLHTSGLICLVIYSPHLLLLCCLLDLPAFSTTFPIFCCLVMTEPSCCACHAFTLACLKPPFLYIFGICIAFNQRFLPSSGQACDS